jgi:hypothetical protein
MLQLEEFYYPKQTANITDLETGTRNLDAEGLGALRAKVDDVDLPPPGSRGGPDDIAAPIQSAEETIKQLRIQDPDLADQVRKMVDQGIMTRGNQGAMPVKRANAREFLVEALKKDTLDPATSGFGKTNLNDIVSAEDVKFITEGGGGIGGDPLLLVEKYFGPRIVELIPDKRITPRFINRLLTNVRDDAGRAPDDPRFDRFTATLINEDIPFAEGGRAGFMAGGIGRFSKAQVLIQRLKNTIKENPNDKYVQETFPGFIKEIKDNPKLAENENVFKALGGDLPSDQRFVVYSDDTVDFYKQSEGPSNIAYLERFMKKHPFLSREDALRIIKMEPEDQVLEITRLQVLNNRTKNANGGLAKILEV